MRIDVKKLNDRGFAVEINSDQSQIEIYPVNGSNDLFRQICKLLDHDDLRLATVDAERITDKTVREVQRQQLFDLMD